VLLANTAHPLNPSPEYDTTTLDVLAWRAPEELLTLDNTEPEYQRAVQNTENAWKAAQ
ncbi:MAG: urea carboxylase, partial [Rhodococcus sp. (in: high G+C Gram-positive bacteria)]